MATSGTVKLFYGYFSGRGKEVLIGIEWSLGSLGTIQMKHPRVLK